MTVDVKHKPFGDQPSLESQWLVVYGCNYLLWLWCWRDSWPKIGIPPTHLSPPVSVEALLSLSNPHKCSWVSRKESIRPKGSILRWSTTSTPSTLLLCGVIRISGSGWSCNVNTVFLAKISTAATLMWPWQPPRLTFYSHQSRMNVLLTDFQLPLGGSGTLSLHGTQEQVCGLVNVTRASNDTGVSGNWVVNFNCEWTIPSTTHTVTCGTLTGTALMGMAQWVCG